MDNYIVSARKYRPSTFRDVVGQKTLTTTLKHAIGSHKLAHAYLFCGPRGVGKTSCARIFAKTINCLNPTEDGEACNECESCCAFNEQRSYNIHELDAASNNSVDDIRSLIDQVRIPPPIGKYKVFIIDEVHMLSSAAFNAFLKTLEEPPHHALFILATTEKHKVLPTILSRCQVYDFGRITIADIVEHLQYVASQENILAEPEALNIIAQKADGGMRDALSIFDQAASYTNGNITYQAVIDNLNVLDYEYYFRLTDCILSGNIRAALLLFNEILNKGFDGQNIVTGLTSHFRDLLVCKDESTLQLFEVGASIRERYKEMAQRCPDQLLFRAIELSNTCDLNYRTSRNKRLLVELLLIQLCQLNNRESTDKKKADIEPINIPQTQQQPANQPISVPTIKKQPEQTKELAAQPASIQAKQEPPATTPKRQAKPPVNTSFRRMMSKQNSQNGQEAAVAQPMDIAQSSPFTQEELTACWLAFANNLDKKVYLKNTMLNCMPTLQDDYSFDVAVHNPGQQDELANAVNDILTYLRTQLHNGKIQMKTRILVTNEKRLAYTSKEKFEHMAEINPNFLKLVQTFGLRID